MNYEFDSMNHPSQRNRLLLWAVLGGITGLVIILLVMLLTQRRDDPDGDETAVALESDESDEKKTDPDDPIQIQRKLATKAARDAQTAFNDAETAKEEADKAIKNFDPKLKEVETYEKWISDAAEAVLAAKKSLDDANAAKDAADNAKDLETAETAANAAVKAKEDAEKAQKDAETAIEKIIEAKKAIEKAAAAQANGDVTLLPFKGDQNLPVKIVFVERLDIDTATDVFAWSDDGKKYDWMKPGKESEPLASRKEEKKKGENQFAQDEIVSATYEIKKRGKPVMIKAGSFSELRFEGPSPKLHSEKFEAYKQVALEFKEHFNKSNFPAHVPLTRTKSLLINFIGEQEISIYPQHFEIIIGPERTNLAKTEFNSTLEDMEKMLNGLRENSKEKEQNEQQKARERIARMLGKEVTDIKWHSNNPVANAITQIRQYLSAAAQKENIDYNSISIPARTFKEINAISDARLKVEFSSLEQKQEWEARWRRLHGSNRPPTTADIRVWHNDIKSKFRKYANAEIAKFKDAGLEKAFAKDIVFNPAQAEADLAKWTTLLDNLKVGSQKLETLEKSIFDPKQQAWQLKDGKTVLLTITPN
jgi:hypothetical protein